ncbi:MAG: HD domain-containing protein [Spirochaetaceae bacterium]|jgi:putative nucleotidyltransferase with HDIG domain|nr:HD domain-containing protein [Spirochaetaceae bacterium]
MNNWSLPRQLTEAAAVFARRGKKIYLVGGAVRDLLRGAKAQDFDLATDARPEEVRALFDRVIPTGIRHGTVTVLYRGLSLEVTTFRAESAYSDGRRPDNVSYAATIEEDLSRRDFTMNAAALKLPGKTLVDPFDGRGDIGRRIIRAVGKAGDRFAEDGLRALRAVRFAAQLGFDLDGATFEAIGPALNVTAKVSAERVRGELDKILMSPRPSAAFTLMEKSGLLALILPELAACRGVEQKGRHRFDVLDHSLLACDYAASHNYTLPLRLAALLHDLGKPQTARIDEAGQRSFYRHEVHSSRMAGEILQRLRYPNAVTERVKHLVAEHMFHYEETWSDAAVRRFVMRAGEENLPDLYDLRRADAFATSGIEAPPEVLAGMAFRIEAVLARSRALSLKDLAVSGRDLIGLGLEPGKRVGILLGELLEAVVEDPALNNREDLLRIAENLRRRESQ